MSGRTFDIVMPAVCIVFFVVGFITFVKLIIDDREKWGRLVNEKILCTVGEKPKQWDFVKQYRHKSEFAYSGKLEIKDSKGRILETHGPGVPCFITVEEMKEVGNEYSS